MENESFWLFYCRFLWLFIHAFKNLFGFDVGMLVLLC